VARQRSILRFRHSAQEQNHVSIDRRHDSPDLNPIEQAYAKFKATLRKAAARTFDALEISQTTVRNVVGRFSLDQLLSDTAGINLQIKNVIDGHTEPWGTQVTAVEIKDIVLPDNMQRAMAKEAEAERERRAKIVAAEGEYQAAVKLGQAADIITEHPVALQLRTLQTMAEISVERNSTIIFPAQFMTTVQEAFGLLSKDSASK
jgi:regulator of protease activity HflC (stomatin/prohibitin superfamily)